MWEKEKLLMMSNFSFSHSDFYPFKQLSAIFLSNLKLSSGDKIFKNSMRKWEMQDIVTIIFSFSHNVFPLPDRDRKPGCYMLLREKVSLMVSIFM